MEEDFLEQLKKYFEETPREQILEEWKKYEIYDEVGITVEEYLKIISKKDE